jgi:glycosyltransferase involved in cell wall biosynthesis
MTITISIITPVHNRAVAVVDSVKSSLHFLQESGALGEVIVVDDASSDGSYSKVSVTFAEQVASGLVRVIRLPFNIGPTGAKQAGAAHSCGKWLIFMDSDDSFVAGASLAALITLESTPQECPVVFFRCISKTDGKLIGPAQEEVVRLDLQTFLHRGTPGECLPAVRRDCLLAIPYTIELRGFESLTYAELIQSFGSACVSPIILRNYCTEEGGERLSTKRAIRARGCLIAKGYFRMIVLFGFILRGKIFSLTIRFFYHGFNCILYSVFKRIGAHK